MASSDPDNQKKLKAAVRDLESVIQSLDHRFNEQHLKSAKDWPDWFEYLMWAVQAEATAAEMVMYRKAMRGEDLI